MKVINHSFTQKQLTHFRSGFLLHIRLQPFTSPFTLSGHSSHKFQIRLFRSDCRHLLSPFTL